MHPATCEGMNRFGMFFAVFATAVVVLVLVALCAIEH
jgi:hypothetical protein